MSLKLKTLVVIGGGRGIGAAVVKLAAQNSSRIALGFHERRIPAKTLAREIIDKDGDAVAFSLDVANFVSVESFFDQVAVTYGVPDAVANCAGVTGPRGH